MRACHCDERHMDKDCRRALIAGPKAKALLAFREHHVGDGYGQAAYFLWRLDGALCHVDGRSVELGILRCGRDPADLGRCRLAAEEDRPKHYVNVRDGISDRSSGSH